MATNEGGRASWKDPELVKFFIDLCLEEVNSLGKSGCSLRRDSWTKVGNIIKEKKGIKMTQKQLRNEWDFLRKKYNVWLVITGKTGHGYNPITNTVNWDAAQWDEYIKAVPEAKQFRYVGLQYFDELRALFDGTTIMGKYGWGPSKEGLPTDCIGSSSTSQATMIPQMHIEVDSDILDTPTSTKRQKKIKAGNLEVKLMAVLNTLKKNDSPSIDDCNKMLDEVQNIQTDDPLYLAATVIFCESRAYREQWMMFSDKPDAVKLKWIEMVGKRLRLF